MLRIMTLVATLLVAAAPIHGTQAGRASLKAGGKIFIDAMSDDFDTYMKAALDKKQVPLTVVGTKEDADYEMTGTSDTQKASAAKKIFRGSWHSDEQASISIADLKSGEVVFAYTVNKKDSLHGKQSTAEACAKHIKDEIEKRK